MADDVLVQRAKARLFGERTAGLDPEQVRQNALLGTDQNAWPQNAAEFNPVARRLVEEARRRRA